MNKVIIIFIFIILAALNQPVFAKSTSENYSVKISGEAKINKFSDGTKAIGFVDDDENSLQTDFSGLIVTSPKTLFKESGGFSRLVGGSYSVNSWQLTTVRPIGIAVSYNTSGYIEAQFVSLTGFSPSDLSIFPSKIAFGVGSGAGVKGHLFKFYPIVKVSKNVIPNEYTGKFNFKVTVLSL